MNKIAFVTDSTCSMPAEYAQKYNIRVVPNTMIWSGKEYRDGVDIKPPEFFARLKTAEELPTTAAIAPYTFKELFTGLLDDGFDVLGIFASARASRTCIAALEAKEMVGADNLTVLDSNTMGMAVGWPLILASRAAEKGASLAECTALAQDGLANTDTVGTVDSLEHLQRSGRIGLAQTYVGTLLNVKPLLEVRDGQFAPAGRVRTRRKALAQLIEMTVDRVNGRSPIYLSVIHADAEDEAKTLLDTVREQLKLDESVITEFSPNAALQVGPGAIGIQFVAGVSTP